VPVKANSGVRARVPAAGKVLEGDDQPTLLREDQHYLHYITINNMGLSIFILRNCFWKPRKDVQRQALMRDPTVL